MASCKAVASALLDSTMCTSPISSSPLRRKSILPQTVSPSNLSENNDEAERLARRHEITTTTTRPTTNLNDNNRRRSLGLGFLAHMPTPQIAERMSQCIKLSAENKITTKNAFSLEIIDFMTYMIKKQDINMSNLQVASTSLDVSTKIYGYRVDGVHNEILKMMGGLDKQEKAGEDQINGSEEQSTVTQADDDDHSEKRAKKKKRRGRQKICCTVESLRGNIEISKPLPTMMGEEDSQTTDTLNQIILPIHANSNYYLHQYNDVIVDTIERKEIQNKSAGIAIQRIEDFSQLDMCPPLCNFELQGWSVDEEPPEIHPEENNEGRFQFDLDASLPPDDEPAQSDINYFDMDDEEEDVNRCAKVPNQVCHPIIDFRDVVTVAEPTKVSEYSFIQKNLSVHWAGPSHWKISNLKKILGISRVMETCHQGPTRKRKEIEMRYENNDNNIKEAAKAKFLQSQMIKLQSKTKTDWNEEKVTLPWDMHYDPTSATKLYLHMLIVPNLGNRNQLNTTHLSDDVVNYNYNNENDTSNYCPDIATEVCETNEDNLDFNEDGFRSEEDGGPGVQMIFSGNNLVTAPKLANKISITYSLRPKKIDMRQLKKSLWKTLISPSDKENINIQEAVEQEAVNKMRENKRFSEVYSIVPTMLTKTNSEALSFPISFVSLLHLANEKTLKISSLLDMSDFIVEGN